MTNSIPGPDAGSAFYIDHVGVSVSDLDRSVAFYVQNFGFHCERLIDLPDHGRVALLRRAGFAIEMFAFAGALPLPPDRRTPTTDLQTVGVKHFALQADDIIGAAAFLRRRGVEFISDVTMGVRGLRRFFVRDPDGVAIEITENTPAPPRPWGIVS
jgi:glyoxylase I family protein